MRISAKYLLLFLALFILIVVLVFWLSRPAQIYDLKVESLTLNEEEGSVTAKIVNAGSLPIPEGGYSIEIFSGMEKVAFIKSKDAGLLRPDDFVTLTTPRLSLEQLRDRNGVRASVKTSYRYGDYYLKNNELTLN